MEQHMYTYLQKRFGLQSLVLEYASAIISGIRTHGSSEVDVAAFGKILQNALAESFPRVQQTLQDTVERLLRQQLERRFATKPADELNNMWRSRLQGHVSLEEAEAIVTFMYNTRDSDEVIDRVRERNG